MKKVGIFFMGVFTATLLMAVVGGWLFFSRGQQAQVPATPVTSSSPSPKADTEAAPATVAAPATLKKMEEPPAPAPAPGQSPDAAAQAAAVKQIFLRGSISVPEELRKLVEEKKNAALTIRVYNEIPGAHALISLARSNEGIAVKRFPQEFTVPLSEAGAEWVKKNGSSALFVRAVLCFDNANSVLDCRTSTYPNLVGQVRLPLNVASTPTSERNSLLMLPTIVLRRLYLRDDPQACTRSQRTISGTVVATKAFREMRGQGKRFELVAVPNDNKSIPPVPYFGAEGQPLDAKALAALGQFGITRLNITVDDANPKPFSLPIPAAFANSRYLIYAMACKEKESEDDCTARGFPVFGESSNRFNSEYFVLESQHFIQPYCGLTNHLFYLHHWAAAPPASEASMLNSHPPELIEGSHY